MPQVTIRKELLFIIAAVVTAVYVLIRWSTGCRGSGRRLGPKDWARIGIFLYFIALAGVTLFPIMVPPAAEPYRIDFVNWDITNMLCYGSLRSLLVNIGGNILMFVPLLPLIAVNWPKKRITLLGAAVISLIVSAAIEALQYAENILGISDFPIRITDVSDVVLNSIGSVLGYGLIVFWKKFFEQKE